MQQTALFVLRPSETEEKGESVSGAAQGDSDEDSRELGESDLDFRSNPSQCSNGEDARPPIPEGEGEKAVDVTEAEPEATVRLRDAMGREFSFPFELCRTRAVRIVFASMAFPQSEADMHIGYWRYDQTRVLE
jgi:hypothetical protein